mmetsp:Transcript_4194/g.9097  ORF Transcript_4194/g.9097 Transcript_4194/m.9097 type:complete len:890 (+) Transcript_4194:386-3055(+)|eukprot:CAMPEP_0171497758 /NCGR_PEP_ID=MMETSP0958-20121227/7455_1 /TAXON_ID=87120 /ORGANISM="Aurantiochytrium limacinum, Strain ATCCMYA-1381" /LENGTH=889 /DNA_ID=CAMNT_0012032047 /DNA_START=349 /DNA_END=3018 /DNA_ORIENTATION=+
MENRSLVSVTEDVTMKHNASALVDDNAREARRAKIRTKLRARIGFLGIGLSALVVLGQLGWFAQGNSQYETGRRDSRRRELSSSSSAGTEDAFCSEDPGMASFCVVNGTNLCTGDDEYTRVCCLNKDECRTFYGDVCPESYICDAELMPGSTGYGRCLKDWEMNGGAWAYVIIMFYLFLGLAIVCDDYFVASLESISESLNLSEDVAGATFLAAGSSAPELFVSLADNVIANPPKDVGIGTIVGSAIFNILVIIGLTAMLAGDVLHLDWRPLARDVSFYIVSIVVLLAVIIDGDAHWWEGLIMLLIYALYIGFMTVNARIFVWMDQKFGSSRPQEGSTPDGDTPVPKLPVDDIETAPALTTSPSLVTTPASNYTNLDTDSGAVELALTDYETSEDLHPKVNLDKVSGEGTSLNSVQPVTTVSNSTSYSASSEGVVRAAETLLGGSAMPAQGPAVRHTVETSRPTAAVEAAAEVARLERRNSETHVREHSSMAGHQNHYRGDGSARFVAGSNSSNPLFISRNRGFNHSMRFSREGSVRSGVAPFGHNEQHPNMLSAHQNSSRKSVTDVAQAVIRASLESKSWADHSQQAMEGKQHSSAPDGTHSGRGISEGQGSSSNVVPDNSGQGLALTKVVAPDPVVCEEQEDEQESYWAPLHWPSYEGNSEKEGAEASGNMPNKLSFVGRCCYGWKSLWASRLYYVISFPYNVMFRFTIPDCTFDVFGEDKEGAEPNRRIAFSLTFTMSIVWIAVLSYFLVWSASKFGCTVGIPSSVMGLTFIAAGTSVPDAISSIIVARQGQGDMAVANSIGSNIFDILIGLGLPWFLAGLIYKNSSNVQIDDITVGMSFLFAIVVVLVIVLKIARWRLNKIVGGVLLFLYVFYIIFELVIYPHVE